ncbi:C39 family peptidase [Lentilactobacillus sp. Marseille-Q4993]|uniref:C39 family peptidase n=1 Tax=Lentilactobacillus sp. Marseille-Q4993 TaxID=3039492 RepID=UPI0024BC7D63|nr:C39 family peptidase [Lentilactobacillus sp. Marseille-Q4993]
MILPTPHIDQNAWGAINGCEAASLLMGLHFRQATTLNYGQFLKLMPISENANPNEGFGGSPYKNQHGKFEAIFIDPLSQWAAKYVNVRKYSTSEKNFSFNSLYADVAAGNPVVVFVTVHFEEPEYEVYPFGNVAINNHAVLLDGVDDDWVHVNDPIDGCYKLPKEKFERIAGARGMALALTE